MFEVKPTETPGPRVEVRLNIAELGVAALLDEGQTCERIRLEQNDDGSYTLVTDGGTAGESRASGVKPSIDYLVEILNTFGDVFDEYVGEIPDPVIAAWEKVLDDWNDYHGVKEDASPSDNSIA